MPSEAKDISSRADIIRLVDGFYERVRHDDVIGPIFNDVAQVDWAAHLPKMYAFWESILFGTAGFKGNPMAVHRALAQRVSLTGDEFERWLAVFRLTVDAFFAGPTAEDAKDRASRIAVTMQHHINADAAQAMFVRRA
ncbi:MAG: group III truncated hemoglobin [Acidobacteriota bacterium]